MDLFSKRNGLVPEKILQDKDFDVISRRLLANGIKVLFESCNQNHRALQGLKYFHHDLVEYGIKHAYWRHYEEGERNLFFRDIKNREYNIFNDESVKKYVRVSAEACTDFFQGLKWWQVLDILELLIENMDSTENLDSDFVHNCFNNLFVKIGWAYKVTSDGQIISIMDDTSFESLEATLTLTGKWEGVKNHFSNAVSLYKHRPEEQYKEACMASADALDKLAKIISNDDGATIETWLKNKNDLPPQIKGKALGIYHIRGGKITHGNGTEDEIDASFAKWYLVSCSALINWMIEKYA
jgi:hypothetical protein